MEEKKYTVNINININTENTDDKKKKPVESKRKKLKFGNLVYFEDDDQITKDKIMYRSMRSRWW